MPISPPGGAVDILPRATGEGDRRSRWWGRPKTPPSVENNQGAALNLPLIFPLPYTRKHQHSRASPPLPTRGISPTYPRPLRPGVFSPHLLAKSAVANEQLASGDRGCGGRLASGGGIGCRGFVWPAVGAHQRLDRQSRQGRHPMLKLENPDREAGLNVPILAGLTGWTEGPASPALCPRAGSTCRNREPRGRPAVQLAPHTPNL